MKSLYTYCTHCTHSLKSAGERIVIIIINQDCTGALSQQRNIKIVSPHFNYSNWEYDFQDSSGGRWRWQWRHKQVEENICQEPQVSAVPESGGRGSDKRSWCGQQRIRTLESNIIGPHIWQTFVLTNSKLQNIWIKQYWATILLVSNQYTSLSTIFAVSDVSTSSLSLVLR